jgi:Na+/proline symporter
MHVFDWILFTGFLAWVVVDGARRGRGARTSEDYFLAGRSVPWWAMGLSIMATQASAITMVGTTGQGWADGMRFVQFYFALPVAMLLLGRWAVPAYRRARVTTAYEYLERRFDRKTRVLAAFLFLVLRGLSVGFVIYAPSLVLSAVFGLPLSVTVLVTGGIAIAYTTVGGLGAVIATDVKQMTVMALGILVAFVTLLVRVSGDVGLDGAWRVADAAGRLTVADPSFDPREKYTLWSSLLGGLFLFLSYFGTDQSQVQRLLAGRSERDMRGALLLNALAKIPFQFVVLATGVLLFVFTVCGERPVTYDPTAPGPGEGGAAYTEAVAAYEGAEAGTRAAARSLAAGEGEADTFRERLAASGELREAARAAREGRGDTNFVFLDFILHQLPRGLAGLLLAAIFAAALSSIDSEINAMTTVVMVDGVELVRRKPLAGRALLVASRLATVAVGAFATAFALYAGEMGSLIEAVNRVGSYVYGSLLGVFLLAWLVPRANGTGAFVGALAGTAVVLVAARTDLAFLFLNTVGTVTVVLVGILVSLATEGNGKGPERGRAPDPEGSRSEEPTSGTAT